MVAGLVFCSSASWSAPSEKVLIHIPSEPTAAWRDAQAARQSSAAQGIQRLSSRPIFASSLLLMRLTVKAFAANANRETVVRDFVYSC